MSEQQQLSQPVHSDEKPPGYIPPYGQPVNPGYANSPPGAYGQQGYTQPTQHGYPQQPPPPYNTTPVDSKRATTVPSDIEFGEEPVRTVCTACGTEVITSVHFETGTLTWVVCLALMVFGLWLGCCLIPFFLDICKDATHSCPNCRHLIGRYQRM